MSEEIAERSTSPLPLIQVTDEDEGMETIFTVKKSHVVKEMKESFAGQNGHKKEDYVFSFDGRILDDDATLASSGVENESIIVANMTPEVFQKASVDILVVNGYGVDICRMRFHKNKTFDYFKTMFCKKQMRKRSYFIFSYVNTEIKDTDTPRSLGITEFDRIVAKKHNYESGSSKSR